MPTVVYQGFLTWNCSSLTRSESSAFDMEHSPPHIYIKKNPPITPKLSTLKFWFTMLSLRLSPPLPKLNQNRKPFLQYHLYNDQYVQNSSLLSGHSGYIPQFISWIVWGRGPGLSDPDVRWVLCPSSWIFPDAPNDWILWDSPRSEHLEFSLMLFLLTRSCMDTPCCNPDNCSCSSAFSSSLSHCLSAFQDLEAFLYWTIRMNLQRLFLWNSKAARTDTHRTMMAAQQL